MRPICNVVGRSATAAFDEVVASITPVCPLISQSLTRDEAQLESRVDVGIFAQSRNPLPEAYSIKRDFRASENYSMVLSTQSDIEDVEQQCEKIRVALALGISVRASELAAVQRAHKPGELESLIRRDLANAASHPDLHPVIHDFCRDHEDEDVRFGAMFHPSVAEDERRLFVRSLGRAKIRARVLDEAGMRWLARSSIERARIAAASNTTSPELLAELAVDVDGDVRRAVANNQMTSARTLRKLADDKFEGVRQNVAVHRSTPSDVLARLVGHVPLEVFSQTPHTDKPRSVVSAVLADLGWISPPGIAGTLGEESQGEHRSAAKNLKLPDPVFEALWAAVQSLDADSGLNLRSSLAGNVHIPARIATCIAQNEYTRARESLAMNPSLPREVERTLRQDGDEQVLVALAINPSISEVTWRAILATGLAECMTALARNRRTTIEHLRELYEYVDGNEPLAEVLAVHPAIPVDLLEELARHPSPTVRKKVASNYAASDELREELSNDPRAVVARQATKPPMLPGFVGLFDPESEWFGRATRRVWGY